MSTPILPPTPELFLRGQDIAQTRVTSIGDQALAIPLSLKVLMVTEDFECLEIARPKGSVEPRRRHDDHTTICCLLTGRLRLHIGEESFIAEPGDVWVHASGVEHSTEALEASTQIDVKSPACKTW